jgi:hypothetical protein
VKLHLTNIASTEGRIENSPGLNTIKSHPPPQTEPNLQKPFPETCTYFGDRIIASIVRRQQLPRSDSGLKRSGRQPFFLLALLLIDRRGPETAKPEPEVRLWH